MNLESTVELLVVKTARNVMLVSTARVKRKIPPSVCSVKQASIKMTKDKQVACHVSVSDDIFSFFPISYFFVDLMFLHADVFYYTIISTYYIFSWMVQQSARPEKMYHVPGKHIFSRCQSIIPVQQVSARPYIT